MTDKKQYLRKYLLQQKKIERLKEMIILNPRGRSKYLKQIAKCEQVCEGIEEKINNIDDDILREILFLKYICGKGLKEISEQISYSPRHTQRMHITAIEKIEI